MIKRLAWLRTYPTLANIFNRKIKNKTETVDPVKSDKYADR